VSDGARKVFIHSGYVEFHRVCNFAERLTFKIQPEDAAGTLVVTFARLRMAVIMVEELLQALFVFVAVLLIIVIDGLIKDFDVLALVDDFECGELGIAEMHTFNLTLPDTLDEGIVFIEECLPEILYCDVLYVLAEGEACVLEEIIVIDALFH